MEGLHRVLLMLELGGLQLLGLGKLALGSGFVAKFQIGLSYLIVIVGFPGGQRFGLPVILERQCEFPLFEVNLPEAVERIRKIGISLKGLLKSLNRVFKII